MKIPPKKPAIVDELDMRKEYLAELIDLEERLNEDAPDRYNDRGEVVSKVRVIWKYALQHYPSGKPVQRPGKNGEARNVEVWSWTSDSTYYDPNGRMTSRGREAIHALAGCVLTDDEVAELVTDAHGLETLPYALCGKKAIVELRTYTDSGGRERLAIGAMRRYVEPTEIGDADNGDSDLPF